ncbi:MAG: hypothetical protein Q4C70_13675 [Planctomycetia bacterium]|nr:hypothetical protein [Planctomycetia bacterium]
MKRMNLLFLGGRQSGKTTFITRTLYEAVHHTPEWLNLQFSIHNELIPGAIQGNFNALENRRSPGPMHHVSEGEICTLHVKKKHIFWFSVLMELFQKLFLWKPMTELGGLQIRIFEMSIENPSLGQWLLDHSAPRTPLGVILVADPFAVGKTCESHHTPAINAVVDRMVDRFEQIYVNNPETRLPVSVATIVSKAETFAKMQENVLRYVDSSTLAASRRALRDTDGLYTDNYLLNDILTRQSSEIASVLENYDGNFVNILQNEFRHVTYFWAGHQPIHDGNSSICRLTSPLLPLLWLLGAEMDF